MTEDDPTLSTAAPDAEAEDAAPSSADESVRAEAAAATDGTGARIAELEARVAELERQLTHERDAATEYMNRWQRAQADFANFKRRAQQDQQQLQRTLAAEAARLILPALDSFERAFATLPASLRGYTWISGTELIRLQLESALNAVGIRLIEVEPGHAFDPMRHEAIGEVESTEHPAGNVAVIVQRGYHIEGHVLRPALVQLAKAAESATASDSPLPAEEGPGVRSAESATAPAAETDKTAIPAESATGSTSPLDGDGGVRPAAPSGTQGETATPAESATVPNSPLPAGERSRPEPGWEEGHPPQAAGEGRAGPGVRSDPTGGENLKPGAP